MSFPTLAFSGPASGGSGNLSTQGTFTATITGSGDGSLSGTWSYSGHYLDSSALGMLLLLRQKAETRHKPVVLLNSPPLILKLLRSVSFGKLFQIHSGG